VTFRNSLVLWRGNNSSHFSKRSSHRTPREHAGSRPSRADQRPPGALRKEEHARTAEYGGTMRPLPVLRVRGRHACPWIPGAMRRFRGSRAGALPARLVSVGERSPLWERFPRIFVRGTPHLVPGGSRAASRIRDQLGPPSFWRPARPQEFVRHAMCCRAAGKAHGRGPHCHMWRA
jgi:hypothetical protein